MKKKRKQAKNKKKLLIIGIVAGVIVLFVVFAFIWMNRPKSYGIYSWYGTKMKADYIVTLNVDMGQGDTATYDVPFKEYRAIYLYYKNRVSDYIVGSDNKATFTTDAEKNRVLKEATEDWLVEYYSLVSLAKRLGVGFTDADVAGFNERYGKYVSDYALENGVSYAEAEKLYENSLTKLGMTVDYFELNYYRSILLSRIKAAIGRDIEDTINDVYYGYDQIFISYTTGDSSEEQEAFEKITAAKAMLDSGSDFSEVAKKYVDGDSETVYFDSNLRIVESSDQSTVGETTVQAVRALGYGEYSGIMTGETDDTFSYYMIIRRVKITGDFICSDSPKATTMYQYPYIGSSSYSVAYTEYMTYMDAYEQNMQIIPYNNTVYGRIAINTLF